MDLHPRALQIVEACENLYKTMDFREINLKEISNVTEFSRPTIYNYFQSKEEIFLTLLTREYEGWAQELLAFAAKEIAVQKEKFATFLGDSIEKRGLMTKLLSNNLADMEVNSRFEIIVRFKKAYGSILMAMDTCLRVFFPQMNKKERQEFIYRFFPYLMGVHAYAVGTEIQRQAMEEAGVEFVFYSVEELIESLVKGILS